MDVNLDEKDQEVLAVAVKARDAQEGPRIGDFVLFPGGQLERFSHEWSDGIQTSPGGSFYLGKQGNGSLSCGGLNPAIHKGTLELTVAILPGSFWFFHHGVAGAGRGVYFEIPCRVFKTSAPYGGFLDAEMRSSKLHELKASVNRQLA